MNVPPVGRLRGAVLLLATTAVLSGCGGSDGGGLQEPRTNPLGYDGGAAPDTGGGVGGLEAIALFGLVPLVILLGVAALVWLPGMMRGNRYRPAKGWSASPLWFGGPPDPAAAVETARTGELTRGGASGSW